MKAVYLVVLVAAVLLFSVDNCVGGKLLLYIFLIRSPAQPTIQLFQFNIVGLKLKA